MKWLLRQIDDDAHDDGAGSWFLFAVLCLLGAFALIIWCSVGVS